MKKIFILLFFTYILGFSGKKEMIDYMRSHNKNLSLKESSYIYDTTMYYSNKYRIDPALVFSVMKTESHFRHSTVSSAGALGLMQLMSFNFREFKVDNSIEGNIKGGILHLKRDLEKTKNIVDTLVCYNAGCSRLQNKKWLLINETRNYITKINKVYPIIRKILFSDYRSQENSIVISEKETETLSEEPQRKRRKLKIERDVISTAVEMDK